MVKSPVYLLFSCLLRLAMPRNMSLSSRKMVCNFVKNIKIFQTGTGCIKKLLKLTMISENVNQSEPRILYLITI